LRSREQVIAAIQEARVLLGQEKASIEADFKDKLYLAQVAASSNNSFGSTEHFDGLLELERDKLHRLLKRWVELSAGLLRRRYGVLEKGDGDIIFAFAAKLVQIETAAARERLAKFFADDVLEAGLERLAGLQHDCLIGAAIEIGSAVNYGVKNS
jgi:hypothetical protein